MYSVSRGMQNSPDILQPESLHRLWAFEFFDISKNKMYHTDMRVLFIYFFLFCYNRLIYVFGSCSSKVTELYK